jgi:transposase
MHFGFCPVGRHSEVFCQASPTRRYAGLPPGIKTEMRHTCELTDDQWKLLDPLIPKPRRRRDGRGRPWKSRRSVLNGILWVLRTGAPWADLPDRYPSFQTCHRRFQYWVRSDVITKIMTALASQLSAIGAIDVREAFIDATFAPAKRGTQCRKNEAWQGNKDHGRRRSQRLASFCLHRECHPPRSDASYVHLVTDGRSRRAAELDR